MPQTITGILRGNVITLDTQAPIPTRGRPGEERRVRVALEIVRSSTGSSPAELRRENQKRLAQINAAVAGGPDPDERELRSRMMHLLRRRNFDG